MLRRGCFHGNFPQYLRASPSFESCTSRWLFWIELNTVSLQCWLFLCSEEQGAYYSSLLYNGMWKLFWIDYLPYLSDKKLCSPLFLENCEILETISWNCEKRRGCCEALRNAVKLSNEGETVRVEMSRICKFALFTHGGKFLFIAQLDIIRYLDSSLRFLYPHSYTSMK